MGLVAGSISLYNIIIIMSRILTVQVVQGKGRGGRGEGGGVSGRPSKTVQRSHFVNTHILVSQYYVSKHHRYNIKKCTSVYTHTIAFKLYINVCV